MHSILVYTYCFENMERLMVEYWSKEMKYLLIFNNVNKKSSVQIVWNNLEHKC